MKINRQLIQVPKGLFIYISMLYLLILLILFILSFSNMNLINYIFSLFIQSFSIFIVINIIIDIWIYGIHDTDEFLHYIKVLSLLLIFIIITLSHNYFV